MKKPTIKYQLKRDGHQFGMIYDKLKEAKTAGDELVNMRWISKYEIIPIKAVWLKIK